MEMMQATFNLKGGRKVGEVVKANKKTVWVKFDFKKNIADAGAEALLKTFTTIIKRHKVKHNVVLESA